MTIVRFINNWDWPDIMRQSPGTRGIWNNIKFTTEEIDKCDYVIVSNYSSKEIQLKCPKENVWCLLQEPPNEYFRFRHQANKVYHRVFTQNMSLTGKNRYVLSQPALPWHIDKTYDFLVKCPPPQKIKKLSWITSNKVEFRGQQERVQFLEKIRTANIDFDLFGRGFKFIKDKWDGLAPYQYSLAIENFSGPFYWSEKLADCFLAWTMPIYYGCTNITDFFPEESMIRIDIKDPDVTEKIKEIIQSDQYHKRLEAIKYARDLVLHKYQFFPYFARMIQTWEKKTKGKIRKQTITIPNENTFYIRLQYKVMNLKNYLRLNL